MNEFAFDVNIHGAMRVTACCEASARGRLEELQALTPGQEAYEGVRFTEYSVAQVGEVYEEISMQRFTFDATCTATFYVDAYDEAAARRALMKHQGVNFNTDDTLMFLPAQDKPLKLRQGTYADGSPVEKVRVAELNVSTIDSLEGQEAA
ncbi:hypothetical protein [Actinomadura atramentaria]|uniref:hypothetical protein n=1 Tax=Actinomadura atramentaria TaxID=1990 RepID=UPI0003A7A96F|nr:hypothetical protein [Actinomadura atramentaria]